MINTGERGSSERMAYIADLRAELDQALDIRDFDQVRRLRSRILFMSEPHRSHVPNYEDK